MDIDRKYAINKKRLTKQEVKDLLATNPPLESEISKLFEWTWATDGYVQKNKLYKLSEDTYLYVYDDKDISVPGRGDIFHKDLISRLVKRLDRKDFESENNLNDSFGFWKYYSRLGIKLIEKSADLKHELSKNLGVPLEKLDYSYVSLDLVSEELQALDNEHIRKNFMDCLTSYIGEVLIRRVNGHWAVTEKKLYFEEVPYISIDVKNVFYNPVNVIFTCLKSIDKINFRKETANEVRSQSSRVAYEKHMSQFKDL